MWDRFYDEPALTLAAFQATIALAVGFGMPVTSEQIGLLVACTAALLGWITRSNVTPVRKDITHG